MDQEETTMPMGDENNDSQTDTGADTSESGSEDQAM